MDDPDLKLEIVLQLLEPNLPPPVLHLSHNHLDLHKTGIGRWGEKLILFNRQRGYRGGKLVPNVSWLDVSQERFRLVGKGARQEIDLSVDYRRIPFGRRHQGAIEVQPSQGQRQTVSVTLDMSVMDYTAQVVRVVGKGTGALARTVRQVHRKVRRPVEFHLANVVIGAMVGYVALQEAGLAIAGLVTGPILLYALLLGGLWTRSVVQAARKLGKDQPGSTGP